MRKKGFTLIELLAVLVIIAIFAIVAIPIVFRIFTKARKSAFQDSAYGIMEAAKRYYVARILDGETTVDQVFSFEEGASNELSYNGSKPNGGILTISKGGKIGLTIHNNEWCAMKSKTDTNIKLIKYKKEKCKIPDESEIPLITVKDSKSETIEKGVSKSILEYFNILSGSATCKDTSNENIEVTNTSSLDKGTHVIECTITEEEKASKTIIVKSSGTVLTEEKMITEVGENGAVRTDNLGNKRYAGSNPNNYVCFGTQNEMCDENHLYRIIGIIDGKMKIIKNSFYSTSKEWDTSNSNNWDRPSTLKIELNGTSFYENTNYIDDTSRSYIANGIWYTGGMTDNVYTLASFVDNERSSSATGYIGLMNVTDYVYGSNDIGCERNTPLNSENVCTNTENYLYNRRIHQWTLTINHYSTGQVWTATVARDIRNYDANGTYGVRPSLFLKSEVKITSGKGTEQEPYRLVL